MSVHSKGENPIECRLTSPKPVPRVIVPGPSRVSLISVCMCPSVYPLLSPLFSLPVGVWLSGITAGATTWQRPNPKGSLINLNASFHCRTLGVWSRPCPSQPPVSVLYEWGSSPPPLSLPPSVILLSCAHSQVVHWSSGPVVHFSFRCSCVPRPSRLGGGCIPSP